MPDNCGVNTPAAPYRFGDFELDPAVRELRRCGSSVPLEPKAFDLLCYLIENRHRTVGKDEMLEVLWPRMVVSDASLTTCIRKARKAVGDSSEAQSVIRTSQRRGYRFVAPLLSVETEGPRPPVENTARPQRPEEFSLVVLPFSNLGGTPETEMLADGLTEDVITDISRNGWLFVIARNSSFAYKGRDVSSRTVADELGVRYIVEGSVRQLGNRIRVAAQLVDADTGMQEWAHRYDRPLTDLFDVQDEITRAIVASLGSELRRAEGRRARRADPAALDAWGLIHRGMAISWSTFNAQTNAEAEKLYRRAIEIAPDNPRAHAFLACSLAMKAVNGWSTNVRADRKEAWVEAQRALDAASDDPIVLGQLGHLNACLDHPDVGLRLLDLSIELDPNNAFSIGMRAYALTALGRAEEAIAAVEDVRRRSPRDPSVHWYLAMLAWAFLQLERFDDCAKAAKESIAHYNGWQPPWITLAVALAAQRDVDEAARAIAAGRRIAPAVPRWGYEAFFRYHSRDEAQAERAAALLREAWTEDLP